MDKKDILPMPFEPKKKNRWLVIFPEKLGIQEWWLQKGQRPKHGNGKWCDFTITVYDPISPSAAQAFFALLETYGTKKKLFGGNLFTIELELLDPTGVVIEKWEIDFSQIKSMDFGSLDVKANEFCTITTTFKVSNAKLIY